MNVSLYVRRRAKTSLRSLDNSRLVIVNQQLPGLRRELRAAEFERDERSSVAAGEVLSPFSIGAR